MKALRENALHSAFLKAKKVIFYGDLKPCNPHKKSPFYILQVKTTFIFRYLIFSNVIFE